MPRPAPYITPKAVPYIQLSIASAFRELTPRQKLYAHHLMAAGWHGVPVVAKQLSPESLPLLRLFHQLLSDAPSLDEFKKAAETRGQVPAADVESFLEYVALVYANMGNYLSFGDSKFVPSCSLEAFAAIVKGTAASNAAVLDENLLKAVYDLSESKLALDFPPKGVTAYYSDNITAEDVALCNDYLKHLKIEGINTRIWKGEDGVLTILIASAEERQCAIEEFRGRPITLCYGDHKEEMRCVVEHLKMAQQHVENAMEYRMLDHYIKHFTYGSVEEHKESQKEWVRNVGPAVECNIGFVESYRDPSGLRAEWEGFVAVVKKSESCRYGTLVENAEQFIRELPWGRAFEKDLFLKPDFTSLEVLGFASSGIPSGICIPNYDDIRQEVGFKNVYLSNVVNSINFSDKLNHLTDADWEIYKGSFATAMSVNVGIHELLGHGSGKLFIEKEDGTCNFDRAIVDPFSGQPVASWYKPGETFNSVFGATSSSYEECRAEAVSLYLCVQPELLKIFNLNTFSEQWNAVHVCWLNMVRAGLVGLEFYTPETRQWRQAHMRARYAILQALLRASNPIVHIASDDKEGLLITIDKDRIQTDGVKAIGELLVHLSVNKSIANASRGIEYFSDLTEVCDKFAAYREIVLSRQKPRKQFVQAHTFVNPSSGDVQLQEFEGSVDGMLTSFITRHRDFPL